MQTNTYCRLCDGACGLVVDLDDNRVSGVRGDPSDPVSEGYSCEVADASVQAVSHPNRVTRPLKREGGELVPCSWDEAISEIGAKLREIRGQSGPASLGLYLGDAVQRSSHSLARALTVGVGLGTPNILSTQCREAAPRIRAAELALGHPVNLLTDLTVYRRLYSPPNLELWKQGRAHQIDLVIALRDGDADRARAIMTDHMQTAWTLMRGQEVEMRNRFISE